MSGDAGLLFCAEDEILPRKTSSLWKRKGGSRLSSLAAPDSATSAAGWLVTSRNNLHLSSGQLPGLRPKSVVLSHRLLEPGIARRPGKAICFPSLASYKLISTPKRKIVSVVCEKSHNISS